MVSGYAPFDALRLAKDELRDIRERLNAEEDGSEAAQKRRFDRFSYFVPEGIVAEVEQPGGSKACYVVQPRNISQEGLAFLHGNFIHPGVHCTLTLKTVDGERTSIRAIVVACRHVRANVHHVGVRFESQITVADFSADAQLGLSRPTASDEDDERPSAPRGVPQELVLLARELAQMAAATMMQAQQLNTTLSRFVRIIEQHGSGRV